MASLCGLRGYASAAADDGYRFAAAFSDRATLSDAVSAALSSACTKCDKGKFGDEGGLADCKDCPEGRFATAIYQTECASCSAGPGQGQVSE